MTLRLQNGEFVPVPGDDVVLSLLRADIKAQVWRGMKKLDPAKAAAWATLAEDETFAAVQAQFGGGLVLTRAEFTRYKEAGSQPDQCKQKEVRTC